MNEKLKTIGLESEYLETDLELFNVFEQKLLRNLKEKYRPLLDLVVPARFSWQTTVIWLLIKCTLIVGSTYDNAQKAMLTLMTKIKE